MKKKLILLLSVFAMISCEVSSVDVSDENYVFDGRGGIKCKVDGKLIKPKVSFSGTGLAADVEFISWNNEEYLSVDFLNGGESPDFISQSVRMKIIDVVPESVQVGDIYILDNEQNSNYGKYSYGGIDFNYSTNDQNIGELEIVFHDLENRILGGTFEYDAIDENGVIVEIRDGEFDMKY
ncbi:hypothetical protein DFQ10_1021 [Winogradskyella eximia]|uniref:Uncharacterized protein n=1 Tax=Winogradskyella eximia TaxID=262006 RepID=A0A3D9H6M4_9FLAO|nr:hypothetical protein [Winogradskyella eximia]RED45134.1 hypothetical protein DFQ10_1021 [Winogradskyella eximia]